MSILGGKNINPAATDLVLINAAAAIHLCGLTGDLKAAAKLSEESTRPGSEEAILTSLIKETNE